MVWAAGLLGALWLGSAPGAERFDPAGLTTPFGATGDLLVAPAARWDAVWFLTIAHDGYGTPADHPQAAFFPLYPLAMRALGWVVGSPLLAGVAISLACLLVALAALHRLAALELGSERAARTTVLLTAFAPAAVFLSAVYSEALFLAVSVGALLAARQGRWAWAGALGALAALTRSNGVLIVVPLALLFLYGPRADRAAGAPTEPATAAGGATGPVVATASGAPTAGPRVGLRWARLRPRHRPDRRLLWLALVPAALALWLGWCWAQLGDPLAPYEAQALWLRSFEPLGAVSGGVDAAIQGARQLLHSAREPRYFTANGGDPFVVAGESLMLLGFLVFALVATVGVLRRLPLAYGAYVVAALLLPLSYPVSAQPLMSLPRYLVTLFPLHLWLALWADERGGSERAIAVSAVLLGLFTAAFVHWSFVA